MYHPPYNFNMKNANNFIAIERQNCKLEIVANRCFKKKLIYDDIRLKKSLILN